MILPESIQRLTGNLPYTRDDIGLSGSEVRIYEQMVLKVQPSNEETRSEQAILNWLRGKLPVPKVLGYCEDGGKAYLLMEKMEGEMLCSARILDDPEACMQYLCAALKMLWQVNIAGCPVDWSLKNKLKAAQYRLDNDELDMKNVDMDLLRKNGFETPEALLSYLKGNMPEDDPVLSHGDFCLPNILVKNGEISGFIDLGKCGIADRYCDIAIGLRSSQYNFAGYFGGGIRPGFSEDAFFNVLGMKENQEKRRYYLLLDELG